MSRHQLFRDIDVVVDGQAGIPPRRAFCVYKHLDVEKRSLYVGYTQNFFQRHAMHSSQAFWWRAITAIVVVPCDTREQAREVEWMLIKLEDPLFNLMGTTHDPVSRFGGSWREYVESLPPDRRPLVVRDWADYELGLRFAKGIAS